MHNSKFINEPHIIFINLLNFFINKFINIIKINFQLKIINLKFNLILG